MRHVRLSDGVTVPAIGQGTWRMGENADRWDEELSALRCGLDLGLSVVDTAEIYGNGRSERLVGEAIAGRRDETFLVSKIAPGNASRQGTLAACEESLKRLRTDRIDLYLLHWRGLTPLAETVEAFLTLKRDGKILRWGISNFDREDIEEGLDKGSEPMPSVNQLYYSLEERGIEYQFMDWMNEREIAVMAYTPFGLSRRLLVNAELKKVADRHEATPAQIALAFAVRDGHVLTIPKASNPAHTRENANAAEIALTDQDIADLDAEFPPPKRRKPLAVI